MKVIRLLFALLLIMSFFTGCAATTSDVLPGESVSHSAAPQETTMAPPLDTPAPEETGQRDDILRISISVDGAVFEAQFLDNESAWTLMEQLPLTLKMADHAGQGKVFTLPFELPPASTENPDTIRAGELYLWSGNQLVLFYTTFANSYDGYVRLGAIEDVDGLAEALGSGDATVTIEPAHLTEDNILVAYFRTKRKLGNGWSYQFESRGNAKENGAYPVISYLKMAYIIFNEDAWDSEQLKEKALHSEAYANLWLFTAFHFICGWRGSDIVRIPMPSLPCDGKMIREQIATGIFDAVSLLEEVELRLRYMPMKPNKTKSYNVPELKLFIAESLRKPLGFILAIAASYHKHVSPGDAFIRRAGNIGELQGFFGVDFVTACENKGFSTRRANKSYLQGIESAAGNAPGKPKGYMLAALARSHKNGYGALAQTTEIYLRDARFSGYSPEFIALEMFERGIFSFIPALLLDMYEGKHYEKLPVVAQTNLMAEIGVSPSGLEGLTSTVQRALAKSRKAIMEIMKHPLGSVVNRHSTK